MYDLPKTYYHYQQENPVQRIFAGRIELEYATAWLEFEKGNKVQHLLHAIKYGNRPEMAEFLGERMSMDLWTGFRDGKPEVVIPVPLHPSKRRLRGYNQSECLAKGISHTQGIAIDRQSLIRLRKSESQTRKKRYARWENVQDVFEVRPQPSFSAFKHILLIDDVITTGATLEACFRSIREHSDAKVSVMVLARSN